MATGRPQLTKVVIDSIDVSSYLQSWSSNTNRDNSTIKALTIVLAKSVSTVLTAEATLNGKSVTVQRGVSSTTEKYILRGEVINVSPSGGSVIISCADKMYSTTKRTLTKSFDKDIDSEAGKYSEIFKTLINDYTDLTADNTSVQDSGTTNVITKFICRSVSVFDRLKALADTIGWQFYYNSDDDLVYFEPEGHSSQSTIVVSGTNMSEVPKWDYDASELYNSVELRGAQQEVETTETGQIGVTSEYTTTSVTLTNTPVSVKVYCDSSNPPTTLKKGGISSSTATYDYQVDKEQKKIIWSSSFTPGGSDYVIVNYSYNIPVPVVLNDATSQETYGDKKKILHKYDIVNINDAENYATRWLAEHKDPIIKTTLKIQDISDLDVGQSVRIQDPFNDIDDDFIVVRIKMEYPYRQDEIEVVSKIIDTDMFEWEISRRVKRLEEQNASDTDLLLHVFSVDREALYDRRYIELQVKDRSDDGVDTFILSHPTFGVLGTQKLGDAGTVAITKKIVQGNNTYEEYLYDDDFLDSVNTTADWDTTNKWIDFGADEIVQTSQIALGYAFTYYTVSLGSVTGDILTEISGDNGNTWQTVTLNIRTAFTSSDGTGVLLRITENASSTAKIENTYTLGAYNKPAMKVKLE